MNGGPAFHHTPKPTWLRSVEEIGMIADLPQLHENVLQLVSIGTVDAIQRLNVLLVSGDERNHLAQHTLVPE